LTGFHEDEKFRIGINGETYLLDNEEVPNVEYKLFESNVIPEGTHSLDISILSNLQTYDPNFESTANVVIYNATIENTIQGGASSCLPCPEGYVNDGSNSFCSQCPPGSEPNSDQSGCVQCDESYINPISGGKCQKCPTHMYGND